MYIHYSINSTDLYVRDDCLCSFQNRHFKIVICVDRRRIKRIKFDNTVNNFGTPQLPTDFDTECTDTYIVSERFP